MSGDLPDRALVVGAARSGIAVAGALVRRGVEVMLHDASGALRPEVAAGVRLALGDHDPTGLVSAAAAATPERASP